MLCQAEPNGGITCLVKDDRISVAGVIVAGVFAFVVFGAIALMIFYSCRERALQRKHAAQEEAALIAREAKKAQAGKRPSVGVRSVSAQSGVADTGYAGGRVPSGGAVGGYSDGTPLMYGAQPMGSSTVVHTVGQDPFADQYGAR